MIVGQSRRSVCPRLTPRQSRDTSVSGTDTATVEAGRNKRSEVTEGLKTRNNSQMAATEYWLMKTEPNTYSIDDLAAEKNKTTCWDGVRNYQARNSMRDDMKIGHKVLLYHSNAKPTGVVGVATVVKEAYVDHTAFDKNDKHFDPKSKKEDPRWFMVDIKFAEKFARVISLDEIKTVKGLEKMVLLNNSRLSVQPVTQKEFETIVKLSKTKTD